MQNKITSGTSATNLTPKNKVDVDVLKKRIFHKKKKRNDAIKNYYCLGNCFFGGNKLSSWLNFRNQTF